MKTIAISHTWPDIKNAEYEVLQRLINAAELLSVAIIIVDRHGVIIWHSKDVPAIVGETIRGDQADFLLSLHFESPKVVDLYSYYTLWQPLDFYVTFGYERTIRAMSTHDDLISCDSYLADAHGLNIFNAKSRTVPLPLPQMWHTLPQPFLEPKIDDKSRLFYVGVNWERLGKAKGRFHDALVILANKDLVDIYGPELLLGAAPWADFPSYQGELPFDGEAIKFALNRAGICLALSSTSHVETGIMSNRLFEGFAGGAAVICNNNPFIEKHFANEVYLVDSEKGEESLAMQIIQILRKIRSDPDEANTRVARAQEIMRSKFTLEGNLRNLIDSHSRRIEAYEQDDLKETSVSVIADFRSNDLARLEPFVESLKCQRKASIDLFILCEADKRPLIERRVERARGLKSFRVVSLEDNSVSIKFDGRQPLRVRRGAVLAKILGEISTSFFAFANPAESFFSDHFARVAAVIERTAGASIGVSSVVSASSSLDGTLTRALQEAAETQEDFLSVALPFQDTGRFVFESSLVKSIPEKLFQLLDGSEHLFLQAVAATAGPVARTFQPTLERDLQAAAMLPPPDEGERRYIKDFLQFQPSWLRAATVAGTVSRRPPGTPPDGWDRLHQRSGDFPRIRPNWRYETKAGAEGSIFLVDGFSDPEAEFTWCLERGLIDFSLHDDRHLEAFSFTLRVALVARPSNVTQRPQHLTVAFNGVVIGYYPTNGTEQTLAIHLPLFKLPVGNRFRVELIPDHAEPYLSDAGVVMDARLLSFRISSFVLQRTPFVAAPRFDVGETISVVKSGYGSAALAQGFHKPEEDLVWVAGTQGKILFHISEDINIGIIELSIRARSSLENGKNQTLSLAVNGRDLGTQEVAAGQSKCSFAFECVLLKDDVVEIGLQLAHAEAVYDERHAIIDPRLLGLGLIDVAVRKHEPPVANADQEPLSEQGSSRDEELLLDFDQDLDELPPAPDQP